MPSTFHPSLSLRRTAIVILLFVCATFIVGTVIFRICFSAAQNNANATALYHNSAATLDSRVDDLLVRMTIDEKIGQMALVEHGSLFTRSDIARFGIGALLSGGGGGPESNLPDAWLSMIQRYQSAAASTRLGIPLLYGADAVHGHTNVYGATIFPHALGLSATNNPELLHRIGKITGEEMAMTGVNWNFSPTVDIPTDTRWGRTYETFGTDPERVQTLTTAYIEGLQSTRTVATAKHFLGTGAMEWGTSTNPDFHMDQGAVSANEDTLRSVHLPPFASAIDAGVESIMISHSSWNGIEMVANRRLLTDLIKGELGFTGFLVSDWYGVNEISDDTYTALVTAVNAGLDMVMLPYDYHQFTQDMQNAIERGDISLDRLNDAVRRILRVKFAAGLFDAEPSLRTNFDTFGSEEHRNVAREAVQQSLVLLKNAQNTLPLSPAASRILVAGSAADNIGQQSGGWTIEWRGVDGNWIPGTSILQGIRNTVSADTTVEYEQSGDFSVGEDLADIGIVVVGETPYAEGWGDNEHPMLSAEDLRTIRAVHAASKKTVVVLISGRPLDIHTSVHEWDAVVAAWLPGSEGEGVADVLFGRVPFTGTLPMPWPL